MMASAGPASNRTSRPAMKALSGRSHHHVGGAADRPVEHGVEREVDQEEDRRRTPRPSRCPARSAGPRAAPGDPRHESLQRSPIHGLPMTTCWPPGEKLGRRAQRPADDHKVIARRTAFSSIVALPPITTTEPSITAVAASRIEPRTTTTSCSTCPSMMTLPKALWTPGRHRPPPACSPAPADDRPEEPARLVVRRAPAASRVRSAARLRRRAFAAGGAGGGRVRLRRAAPRRWAPISRQTKGERQCVMKRMFIVVMPLPGRVRARPRPARRPARAKLRARTSRWRPAAAGRPRGRASPSRLRRPFVPPRRRCAVAPSRASDRRRQ